VAHIVEDLFRWPVSKLMGNATNSFDRLSPALPKSGLFHGSLVLLSSGSDRTPNKATPGSLPAASFSIRQT
jgi:hypothetical protein